LANKRPISCEIKTYWRIIGQQIVFFVVLLALLTTACGPTSNQVVTLQDGPREWTVYVDGQSTRWQLAYQWYADLPIKSADYLTVVRYREVCYEIWRVTTWYLQVSSPIDCPVGRSL